MPERNRTKAGNRRRHDAQTLNELRAIRGLLDRTLSVLAWNAGLQRDPFSPSPLRPEQASEEALSAREALQQWHAGLSATPPDAGAVDRQSASPRHGCSESEGVA